MLKHVPGMQPSQRLDLIEIYNSASNKVERSQALDKIHDSVMNHILQTNGLHPDIADVLKGAIKDGIASKIQELTGKAPSNISQRFGPEATSPDDIAKLTGQSVDDLVDNAKPVRSDRVVSVEDGHGLVISPLAQTQLSSNDILFPVQEINRLVKRSSGSFQGFRGSTGEAKDWVVKRLDGFDNLWKAATLLRNHVDEGGLAAAIMPLVDDPDAPVRKAALLTLGAMLPQGVTRVATRRLSDPAPFVRSAAILALAQVGERSPDRARRRAIASSITPLLADREWGVRAAAKDALVRLGPGTWREVAAQLSSPDGFARNGAAEVLQNLGVLDWTLRGIASGAQPTDEAVDVLRRALREGGVVMSKAAALRSKDEPIPGVEQLLRTLQLEGAFA